jgi:hypothetical protein
MTLAASAALLSVLPLVAANVNGFENFVLTRNDYKSASSGTIADFSSRTRTAETATFFRFNSGKPCGITILVK